MSTLVAYKPREIVDNASTARAPLSAGHVHGRRFRLNLAPLLSPLGLLDHAATRVVVVVVVGTRYG